MVGRTRGGDGRDSAGWLHGSDLGPTASADRRSRHPPTPARLRVDLTDLWSPAQAAPWLAALCAAAEPSTVLRRLADTRRWEVPGWVTPVAGALAGGRRVDDVADLLGGTTRTFHRRALRHYGYGPKTLQRILRVRAARADLAAGVEPAQVSADRHFADQPHMHREFLDLASRAPGSFRCPPPPGANHSSVQ